LHNSPASPNLLEVSVPSIGIIEYLYLKFVHFRNQL
jgi:hypothetical protein